MTDFEKTISETANLESTDNYCRENAIYWITGDKTVTVQMHQGKFRSRIQKLAEKYPDDVKIVSDKFGVMVATLPLKAIKINIVERVYTEEERKEVAERFHKSLTQSNE